MKELSERLATSWKAEYDDLALYNSEIHRGIVHTERYDAKMRLLQTKYDKRFALNK